MRVSEKRANDWLAQTKTHLKEELKFRPTGPTATWHSVAWSWVPVWGPFLFMIACGVAWRILN